MTFFQSPLTMLLIFASAVLMLGGGLSKKGNVLSFFGALCCVSAVLSGLAAGAELSETLLYVLSVLLLSGIQRREKK